MGGELISQKSSNLEIASVWSKSAKRKFSPRQMEADANAQLMAAAPELLACLEGCIGYLMSLPNVQRPDPDWFKPASAAIAKARRLT